MQVISTLPNNVFTFQKLPFTNSYLKTSPCLVQYIPPLEFIWSLPNFKLKTDGSRIPIYTYGEQTSPGTSVFVSPNCTSPDQTRSSSKRARPSTDLQEFFPRFSPGSCSLCQHISAFYYKIPYRERGLYFVPTLTVLLEDV